MSLFIRDPEVNELATEAVRILGAKNKTEAVREALKSAIRAAKGKIPLRDRIEAARRRADEVGPVDPTYDHKRDMDALWED